MANPVIANITKSKATVYLAPVGTALPDPDTVGAGADWAGSWVRVGLTKEPVAVRYESEEAGLKVQEYLAEVKRSKTSESLTIETVLAELTADYLQYVTGGVVTTTAPGAGAVGYDELDLGNDDVLTEYALGIEGRWFDASDNEFPVRFLIYRVTMKMNGPLEFSMVSDDYVGISLQAMALMDETSGRLMKVQRVTLPGI